MKLVRSIAVSSLVAVSLCGCSAFKQHTTGFLSKRDSAYVKAKSGPGLQIPAGLSSSKVGDEFSIPPVTSSGPVPASDIPPGGISKQVPPGYVSPTAPSSKYFLKPLMK